MIAELFNQLFDFTLRNVIYFFWLPAAFTLFGYILISVSEYKDDVNKRKEAASERLDNSKNYNNYIPKLKLGHIVGRFLVSFIPLVNLLIAIFKFVPRLGGDVINACEKWLDIPLVPKIKN